MNKQTTLLALANVLVLIGIYFALNLTEAVDKTENFVESVLQEQPRAAQDELDLQQKNIELMKQYESEKVLESITIQEKEMIAKEKTLAEREKKLVENLLVFEEEKKIFIAQREHFKKEQVEKENYDQKLISLANKFTSMPPQKAVERLVAIGDDVFILDILGKIDVIAEGNGKSSIVPFFISLMSKEDASRIVRNSVVNF